MAKDDYNVIVYKVLLYLYACMKREIVFDVDVFNSTVKKSIKNDEYFTSILRLMQSEGLISGLTVVKAWGPTYILVSDLQDMEITAAGINYLKENSTMERIKKNLLEAVDTMSNLIGILGL